MVLAHGSAYEDFYIWPLGCVCECVEALPHFVCQYEQSMIWDHLFATYVSRGH